MDRLALREHDVRAIEAAFAQIAPLENGAFLLVDTVPAQDGLRYVAHSPYLPQGSEWAVQREDQLEPSPQLLSKVVSAAQGHGLLFVHSHPDPCYPVGLSFTDRTALERLAEVIPEVIDGPFIAGVVGPKGWHCEVLEGSQWVPVPRLLSAGPLLRILGADDRHERRGELDSRQVAALGSVHDYLGQLDIVVVGAGGLGSPLVEVLVRMGAAGVTAIDPDVLDSLSGGRRVWGTKMADYVASPAPAKAEVVVDHTNAIGLSTRVIAVVADVRDRSVLPFLASADVIISTTDTHSSRAYLNDIAYAFNVPLIDGGVQVGHRNGTLDSLAGEIRLASPALPCLWCHGVLSAETIRNENLPPDQREALERDGYVHGSHGAVAPSVAALTLTGAGLLACRLLGLLTSDGDRIPGRYQFDGLLGEAFERKVDRLETCRCRDVESMGPAELGL